MALTPEDVNSALAEMWPGNTSHLCAELSATEALAKSDLSEVSTRPGGFVSGPTQFGLADAALWYMVFGALDQIEPMAMTSELSIRYLRPGQGDTLWARATLDKVGRRSVVGTVSIWTDNNKPCATAQGTYMLPHTA